VVDLLEDPAARQFHLEYRAADAAACPHLCLGAMVRAGLTGIREGLPAPPVFERDPIDVAADERERLPETLEAALDALQATRCAPGSPTTCGMLPGAQALRDRAARRPRPRRAVRPLSNSLLTIRSAGPGVPCLRTRRSGSKDVAPTLEDRERRVIAGSLRRIGEHGTVNA
jgi:hypothetical protein